MRGRFSTRVSTIVLEVTAEELGISIMRMRCSIAENA
jgi:hypothetical protein